MRNTGCRRESVSFVAYLAPCGLADRLGLEVLLPAGFAIDKPALANLRAAVDTDFTAKLVDVYPPSEDFPAGFDMNISDALASFMETIASTSSC